MSTLRAVLAHDGTWPELLTRLRARAKAAGLIAWEITSTPRSAGPISHAAIARRDGQAQKDLPGGTRTDLYVHGLGLSRGGCTTKNYLSCEGGQRPLSLLVTAGQRGDSPQFTAVL
ncbi:hypothetical protein [Streptomyces sp. NPDC127084]|uniref:hypothetical protein n=1 Tax=Streptomyces sp. NPDC127084 TaxID=3347133 RepID=UPI00365E7280